jgi:hypothetical protein
MKYKAFIISICNYAPQPEDSQVVGFSDAMVDYPWIPKPGSVIYDTVDLRMPMGRHPDTGVPLWVDEPTTARRIQETDEEGINSLGATTIPPVDHAIDASLCNCQISDDASIQEIDDDAKYLIWGLDSLLETPVYPVGKEDWQMNLPVSSERKSAFETFMLARGTTQAALDAYWAANPGATYRNVADDFSFFLGLP